MKAMVAIVPDHPDLCSALPLRLVEAIFFSSFSLIEDAIDFDAPFSLLFGVSPRLADRAAPAAFCCAADLAGIRTLLELVGMKRLITRMASTKMQKSSARN